MEKIYPDLEINAKNYQDYTIQDLKNKLARTRLKDFENDLRFLEDKLVHYKKLHSRWKKFDCGIRYTDIIVGTTVGLATASLLIIPSFSIAVPVVITAAAGSIPIVYSLMHGILSLSVFKKISKYSKFIIHLEAAKNKLFLYQQKALEDDILTDEEIVTSKKIVKDAQDSLINTKTKINENEALDKKFLLGEIKKFKSTIQASKK